LAAQPELPIDPVQRAWRLGIADGGAHDLASHHTAQPHPAHQPLDGTTGHCHAFASQWPPDLLDAIDLHVGPPDTFNLREQNIISASPFAALVRFTQQGGMVPIR
jgi:hypothetical protein